VTGPPAVSRDEARARRRRGVRYLAAALSAGCAIVYFAIGFGLIHATEPATGSSDLLAFGVAAGLAFVVGAVLLASSDRVGAWILGAIFQVVVIVMYFAVAETRTPPIEAWGLLLKAAQTAILAALLYLITTAGGRYECASCRHDRRLHQGGCLVPRCSCEAFR
jgi:hypothetical protein